MRKKMFLFIGVGMIIVTSGCTEKAVEKAPKEIEEPRYEATQPPPPLAEIPQEVQKAFLAICNDIVSKSHAPEYVITGREASEEEMANKKKERQALLERWREEVQQFIEKYPDTPLTDDAQYLLAFMLFDKPQERIEKLELLISEYPDGWLDPFTVNMLKGDTVWNKMPLEVLARTDLMGLYFVLGDRDSAEKIRIALIEDYPVFKAILNEPLPQDIAGLKEIPKGQAIWGKCGEKCEGEGCEQEQ